MQQKLLFLLAFAMCCSSLFAQVTPETMRQINLLQQEKNSRTPAQQKIDSRLLQAVRENRGQKMVEGVDLDRANVDADAKGMLKVDIDAAITDAFLAKIKALGGEIIYPSAEYHTVRARVNLAAVETIAGYKEVKFIQPAVKYRVVDAGMNKAMSPERIAAVRAEIMAYLITHVDAIGSVTSQGDAAHGAANVRTTYGYLGAGIKVGVISDSYNAQGGAAADVASGDLPGTGNPQGYTTPVVDVQDVSGASDEGRAMLQVVHDLAPAALLYFATADISEAGFATNIQALRNTYGCNIIIDDVGYFDEAVFQDGTVAKAVDAVTAAGALYFSAAGNSGSLVKGTSGVYEGDYDSTGSGAFSGGSKAGTIHNFGTPTSPVNGDIIKSIGEAYNLTWSDAYGASGNDYDLFYVNSAGTVKSSSTNVQSGTQNPYESLGVSSLSSGDRLVVFKTKTAAVRAFHLNTNRGTLTVATNGQTSGHACAASAFCMAATPAATAFTTGYPTGPYPGLFVSTDKVEPFSSDGPRQIFYNSTGAAITPGNFLFGTSGGTSLAKPDLTAADGVSTTFSSATGLNPFFGTSCSGPHAGAIAALLLSANPSLTTTQMRTVLTSSALDIEGAGYEYNSGYGIVQAIQAVSYLPAITVASALSPTSINTTYGTASSNMGFSVSGANITGGILVTAPTGFEVSLTAGGTYTTTITVGSSGTVASTPVYVRLKASDALGAYSGNIALTSLGANTVNVAISSSTVSAATLTYTANAASRVYGAANPAFSGTVTGFTGTDNQSNATTGTLTFTTTATVSSPVGQYAINGSGLTANNGNYVFAQAAANATALTIGQATPIVTVTNVGTYTYNGNPQGPNTASNTGTGTSYTFSYLGTGGTTYGPSVTQPTNAGSYTVTATVAASGDGNWTAASSAATAFAIGAGSSSITVTGATGYTYNGMPQGPSTSMENGSTGAITYSYAGTSGTTYGPSATAPTNAGNYTATATVAADANNTGATSAAYSFVINPATLTITANNIIKCNGATYVFAGTEFTTTGLVNGDGSSVSSVSLSSSGAAAGATANSYPILISTAVGTGFSNYILNYVNGTLTVETALMLTITQVNPDCYGDPGSLSGSVIGGTAPYLYEVNSGLTYGSGPIVYGPSTTPLYSPAAPGYYTYSATDAAGCLVTAQRLSVNALARSVVLIGSTPASSTIAVCYGTSKTINTISTGGTSPYTYSLNSNGVSGPFVASSSRYFTVLAGTYYITVKDNAGCIYNTDTISITQPSTPVSFTSTTGGQPCNTLGGISVTANGGYGGYSYSDNNGGSYQSSGLFSGLAYGSYTVAVKDQNGCAGGSSVVKFTTLTSSAIAAAKNPICPGSGTTIYTVPNGGTPPYSYSLDGLIYVPSNGRYFYVPEGMHTITVKDNVSCTYGPLSITIDTSSASCAATLAGGAEELQKVAPLGSMFKAHVEPNPAQGAFHLKMESTSKEKVELVVMNMLGIKMYETKGGISAAYAFGAEFKDGIYLLQVRQGNEVHTVKLVKGN